MAEDHDQAGDAALEAALVTRERDVAALLPSNAQSALTRALSDPPFSSKAVSVKDRSANLVMRALVAVSAKEEVLLSFLSTVDPDASDALMKYVVRFLGTPSANSALFLKVHGLLVEKCGLGCLVRSIVDRRVA
jgi:hypothetical protein